VSLLKKPFHPHLRRSGPRGSASNLLEVKTMATKTESGATVDHEEIKRWAEARHAKPACVKGTGGKGGVGMIRLDFPGYSGEDSLEPISWDEWFKAFDENELALVYQEKTADGHKSNFNKLVKRSSIQR
jgi:hypothetical protein